jgi:GNAT superfamily N-acetyltransferase
MVEVREATDADANAVRETAEAALGLDTAEAPALVDLLRNAPIQRRRVALAADGGAGVVCASTAAQQVAGSVDGTPGDVAADSALPRVGYVDLLAVHPRAQGHGLGMALVAGAEQWLAGQGVTEVRLAGHPPCYAWPGIDIRYTPALCLAEKLGYERYRMAWNMTADLATDLSTEQDVQRLAAEGVQLRSAPADEREVVAEFARSQWSDSWAWEIEQAAGCHYAIRSGEVLGFAAWGARPAWFGPMGSAPAARGLGIGRVLLRRCLAEQRDAGYSHAQIGWVGPLRFYSRAVGARAERVFALYRRPLGESTHD